jgi:hypothetical protein
LQDAGNSVTMGRGNLGLLSQARYRATAPSKRLLHATADFTFDIIVSKILAKAVADMRRRYVRAGANLIERKNSSESQ